MQKYPHVAGLQMLTGIGVIICKQKCLMKILKAILIISYIPLIILSLLTAIGFIDRWSNPGYKSISYADLKQIGTVLFYNLIFIIIIIAIRRKIKNTND